MIRDYLSRPVTHHMYHFTTPVDFRILCNALKNNRNWSLSILIHTIHRATRRLPRRTSPSPRTSSRPRASADPTKPCTPDIERYLMAHSSSIHARYGDCLGPDLKAAIECIPDPLGRGAIPLADAAE